jgi:hypothetical protein
VGNDAASSIIVAPGMIASLFADINYDGACDTISRTNSDLRNSVIGINTASSIRIGVECPGFAGPIACTTCKRKFGLVPGRAKDIGAGSDGSVWVIGTDAVGAARDFGVHRWTGRTWETIDGGGVRIAVDPDGRPWVVNSAGQIFQRIGTQWTLQPGLATDIGIGADGSVWVIGTNPVGAGHDFGVFRWNGSSWNPVDGGGVRIAVDRAGNPWVVNSVGQIFQRTGTQWTRQPGLATDIGIGADGSVWVIGTNPVGAGQDFGVFRWNGSSWDGVDGGGVQISVDKDGVPWIANSKGEIFVRP